MIISDFAKFCKKIKRLPKIAFTGGEPLIIANELFDLLDYCNKKFPYIRKNILSNGTLIDESMVIKLKKSKIDNIQISLDGAKEDTCDFIRGIGVYNKALKAIELLNSAEIKTSVMCTFHKKNYKEIEELIELCDSLNVSTLGITALVPEGNGENLSELILKPNETRELYRTIIKKQIELMANGSKLKIDMKRPLWTLLKNEFKNYQDIIGGGCAAGFSGLALMPNEDVMACRRLPIVIGNLTESTFFDVWYSSNLLDDLRNRKKVGKCANCLHIKDCGGCRAVAFAMKGDVFEKDSYCWLS
jgi:radical SAM protein with 4Fe4S-binding SPASM domain